MARKQTYAPRVLVPVGNKLIDWLTVGLTHWLTVRIKLSIDRNGGTRTPSMRIFCMPCLWVGFDCCHYTGHSPSPSPSPSPTPSPTPSLSPGFCRVKFHTSLYRMGWEVASPHLAWPRLGVGPGHMQSICGTQAGSIFYFLSLPSLFTRDLNLIFRSHRKGDTTAVRLCVCLCV